MIKVIRAGGRKANTALLVMLAITVIFLMQYPIIITLMIMDYKDMVFNTYWTDQLPRMSTGEFTGSMVATLTAFGAGNVGEHYMKSRNIEEIKEPLQTGEKP